MATSRHERGRRSVRRSVYRSKGHRSEIVSLLATLYSRRGRGWCVSNQGSECRPTKRPISTRSTTLAPIPCSRGLPSGRPSRSVHSLRYLIVQVTLSPPPARDLAARWRFSPFAQSARVDGDPLSNPVVMGQSRFSPTATLCSILCRTRVQKGPITGGFVVDGQVR